MEFLEPQLQNSSYIQRVMVLAMTPNNTPIYGKVIQFQLDGVDYGGPVSLSPQGRVMKEIVGLTAGKAYNFGALLYGTSASVSEPRLMPALPQEKQKKKTPAELVVDPARVGNKISLFLRVLDEEKEGVPLAKLTIVDSKKGIQIKKTDERGEFEYKIALEEDEEREIQIVVAGYGDQSFRRTFRGRRLEEK